MNQNRNFTLLPKGLIIATSIGVVAAVIFGVFFSELKNENQLVFVDGPALSLVTEKTDFKKGEDIKIRIVNSGTVPITFSDASYGLKITQLDTIELYSPIAAQMISTLEPKEEVTFTWDQIKNDGDPALEGLYKIISEGKDSEQNKISKSITVHIYK